MAWINATVNFNGVTYLSHRRGIIFVVPHCSGLEVGDIFKADSSQFEVLTAVDLHDRGETLVMDTKEIKDDKPKARRNAVGDRGTEVPSEDHNGHVDED